jgi:hypothetical protein
VATLVVGLRPCRDAVVVLLLLLAVPSVTPAQTAAEGRPVRRLEVAVGVGILGSGALGERDAELRTNSRDARPYALFNTDTRLARARVLELRAGFGLTRRYSVEGGFLFGRPELQSSVTGDVEGSPALVIAEQVDQYLADAGMTVALEALRIGPLLPVVSGGAGYLRQLHQGRTTVEQGHFVQAGFGVRHWVSSSDRGLLRGSGIRADARLYVFSGGITVDGRPRPHGAIAAAFFVVF